MSDATEQPMPTGDGESVTPVARVLFGEMLTARERKGIKTYGTTLRTHNGRDAVQDALEECIDLWQYLVQIRMERRSLDAENERLRERVAALTAAGNLMAQTVEAAVEEGIGEDEMADLVIGAGEWRAALAGGGA